MEQDVVAPTHSPGSAAPCIGRRNYPMNCWWVAAFADEIDEHFTARWLLDTPVLLYRGADGRAIALEDRCPHRGAPLSLGSRIGDAVQCGYHGFTFAADGRCVRVPSLDKVPSSIRVRAFPLIEQGHFLWIYLGDPAVIDEVPLPPALAWMQEPPFAWVQGRLDVAANYMLLKENVLDLTHFGYVHAASFKISDWVDPPRLTRDGDTVGYHQSFVRSPLPPIFAEPLGIAPGTPYNRENYGSFLSPALQIGNVDLYDPERPQSQKPGRFRVLHATTPIDPDHMYYFWVVGRDYGTDAQRMAALKAITQVGFAEDEAMIEAVQALELRDRRCGRAGEVSVRADGPAVEARRLVQRWMRRETATPSIPI